MLEIFKILEMFVFTTNKAVLDIQHKKYSIRVAERLKS